MVARPSERSARCARGIRYRDGWDHRRVGGPPSRARSGEDHEGIGTPAERIDQRHPEDGGRGHVRLQFPDVAIRRQAIHDGTAVDLGQVLVTQDHEAEPLQPTRQRLEGEVHEVRVLVTRLPHPAHQARSYLWVDPYEEVRQRVIEALPRWDLDDPDTSWHQDVADDARERLVFLDGYVLDHVERRDDIGRSRW